MRSSNWHDIVHRVVELTRGEGDLLSDAGPLGRPRREPRPPRAGCAGGLTWWSWQRGGIPIKAIVIAIVALVCLVASLVSLFMEFALIIGADRLQNVRNGKVVGQVPYHNIADIVICKKDGVPSLGIKLADEKDAGTFWERRQARWYARSRQAWGHDIFVTPDPSVPVEVILEMIQARKE